LITLFGYYTVGLIIVIEFGQENERMVQLFNKKWNENFSIDYTVSTSGLL